MKFGFLKKAAAVITAFAMTLSMAIVLPEDTSSELRLMQQQAHLMRAG